MFSGIVEEAATVVGLKKEQDNLHITMRCSFTHELKIDQSLTRAHTDLGKLYLMQGDNAAAELEFRRVLEYEPGNSDVRMVLAQHYLRRKKYDQATQEFQSLLRADPENRMARKGLALSLALRLVTLA